LLLLLETVLNCLQNKYNTSRHLLQTSLHYHVKHESLKSAFALPILDDKVSSRTLQHQYDKVKYPKRPSKQVRESYPDLVEYLHCVVVFRLFMHDKHDTTERAHTERLDAVKVFNGRRILYVNDTCTVTYMSCGSQWRAYE